MKKIARYRTEFPANDSPVNDPPTNTEAEEQAPKKPAVQPPLPPYPPPPDSPPNLQVVIKQEKEDDDDVQNEPVDHTESDSMTSQELKLAPLHQNEHNEDKPKKTICKEFIRGNCQRPSCRYAHEVDVSQLMGVFTFCWNYQNGICTYPHCRFVHASVFEERAFYRTGILPPHARSHIKNAPAIKPAPAQESIQPGVFKKPLPPATRTVYKQRTTQLTISCVSESAMENPVMLPLSTSPPKRELRQIEEFSSSPRDHEPNEHLAKKCKKCDMTEFSIKYHKEVMDKLTIDQKEINIKMMLLNKKRIKLLEVLTNLIKPNTITGNINLANLMDLGAEPPKEFPSILERIRY